MYYRQLVNNLFEEKAEDRLLMVVVDEIHMLSDKHRGFLLEVMLSKLRWVIPDKFY